MSVRTLTTQSVSDCFPYKVVYSLFPSIKCRGSAGPIHKGRGGGSIQTLAFLSPLMEGGGRSRHPSRGWQWPERNISFHGHHDQPLVDWETKPEERGVSVLPSILPKSSWGPCQFILANLVVGGGTGQLAQDLLVIAAQVFEQRY